MTSIISISEIHWNKAEHIGDGGYGIVYRVAPTLVAKVADAIDGIQSREVAIPQFFAARLEAVPILDYAQHVQVPAHIRKAACSVHGLRGIAPQICTCDLPVDVLLMPEAQTPLPRTGEVFAFLDSILLVCREQFQYPWDAKVTNAGLFEGHFVALDFGPAATLETMMHR
jgi:hypothetical protein